MSKEHFQYHGRSISFLFYISFDREIENLLKELTTMVIYISTKPFEISLEGEGSKLKGFVTERRKGFVSWIQLGEAGSKNRLRLYARRIARSKGYLMGKRMGDHVDWKIVRMRGGLFSSFLGH